MKTFMVFVIFFTFLGLVKTKDTKSSLTRREKEHILAKVLRLLDESGDTKRIIDQRKFDDEDAKLDTRNAIQLASMVRHTTGTNPVKYFSYGCYCGFSGKGRTVDEIDKCCQTHDRCYGNMTANHGCSEWWRYVNTYSWKIGTNGEVICEPVQDVCKDGQCECDKEMAECFQRHHSVYNDNYTGWWWTLFNDC